MMKILVNTQNACMIWHLRTMTLQTKDSTRDPKRKGEPGPPSQPKTVRDPVKVTLLASIPVVALVGIVLYLCS